MADATKKDFDLHVAVRWIASRNCCGGHWRCLTDSRISFRFVSAWMHTRTLCNNAPASSDAFGEEYLRKSGTQESRIGIVRDRRQGCAGSSERGGSRASFNREKGFQDRRQSDAGSTHRSMGNRRFKPQNFFLRSCFPERSL